MSKFLKIMSGESTIVTISHNILWLEKTRSSEELLHSVEYYNLVFKT